MKGIGVKKGEIKCFVDRTTFTLFCGMSHFLTSQRVWWLRLLDDRECAKRLELRLTDPPPCKDKMCSWWTCIYKEMIQARTILSIAHFPEGNISESHLFFGLDSSSKVLGDCKNGKDCWLKKVQKEHWMFQRDMGNCKYDDCFKISPP